MQNAVAAVRFLTIAGAWHRDPSDRDTLGKGALYYPVVGFFFGALLAIVNRILEPYLESEILGVALIALLTLLSGATHLQGLHEVVDRISLNRSGVEGASGQRAASAISVSGFIAVVLIVLFKVT